MSATIAPAERPLTAADLAVLPDDLPSGGVRYELDDGRLVVLPLPTYSHATAASNISTQLMLQGDRGGHGKARPRVGVILRRNPDRVVGPDACFIANASLPLTVSPED